MGIILGARIIIGEREIGNKSVPILSDSKSALLHGWIWADLGVQTNAKVCNAEK